MSYYDWQWVEENPQTALEIINDLERENAALRKALYAQADYQRELRADRDRLDWLEVHGEPVTYEEAPHELVWCVIGERGQRSIRAAIDAARTKEGKP